jgi:hypothetical protein
MYDLTKYPCKKLKTRVVRFATWAGLGFFYVKNMGSLSKRVFLIKKLKS